MECNECNGSGTVSEGFQSAVNCKVCGGTGVAPIKNTGVCPVVGRREKPSGSCQNCGIILERNTAGMFCDICKEQAARAIYSKCIKCGQPVYADECLICNPKPFRLNLGGGDVPLEGFTVVDRKIGLELYPLAYPDEVADVVYASHCLEHFPKSETLNVLREWVRVLKPGGTIKIAVPDFEWICANLDNPLTEGYVMGGQTDENDFHHALFNRAKLTKLMEMCGLVDIFPWTSEIEDCASLPVSLNLMGTKPGPAVPVDLTNTKIVGCLSCPRVGFNDTWGCIATVLTEWGIPMMPHRGALWEQVMQNMLIAAVAQGYDFAVTFDYDSAFTRQDFEKLLTYMIQNPAVDAVAAFQPMRERSNTAICGLKTAPQGAPETIRFDQPIEALTAHFGLTIFRVSRLKGIPTPWLWSQPGKTGLWTIEDGKVDADCYFWQKFAEHGRVLHVLPWVCIGHIEPMITMLGHVKNEHTGKMESKTITMHSSAWMNRVFQKR